MKLLNSIYIKITSWVLIVSFLVVYIINDYAYAKDYASQVQAVNASKEIDVPFEYGQVAEQYRPNRFPRVILIQDLHANYEVQKNIKGILDHIDNNYGISRVGVEGSSDMVDVSLLKSIPDEEIKEKVIDYFLKKGFVTGTEYFAAYKKPPVLMGLEKAELYKKDTQILISSLNNRAQYVEYLERIKLFLKTVENKICCPDLRKFRNQYILYKQDQISPYNFQEYIRGWANRANISLPGISREYNRFMTLTKKEVSLDYKKIESEYGSLMKAVGMDYEAPSEFSLTFKRFKNIFRGPESVKRQITNLIMSDQAYSNLRKYMDIVELSRQINTYMVLEEEQKVVDSICYGLCEESDEKDYLFVADYVQLLVKFLLNQITRTELDEFYAKASEFEAKFTGLSKKYTEEFRAIEGLMVALKPFIEEMGSFYTVAELRDEEFVKNFLGRIEEDETNLVMVTGGFHTYGLAKRLKENNTPYVIVIPRVTSYTQEDMRLYYSHLRGEELLTYQDMILQNLALATYLGQEWLMKRIIARVTGHVLRRDYEKRGFISKVRDFMNEWVRGYTESALLDTKLDFRITDVVEDKENKEIIFTVNMNGEELIMGITPKSGKLRILTGEDAVKAKEAFQEALWQNARQRHTKANEDIRYRHLFRDDLDLAATIMGLKPVSIVDKGEFSEEELASWLAGIDENLKISGNYVYNQELAKD
ncbi:hypothetical protein ACFLTD_04655, partial [Elusimicrobiota bacterium]